MALFLRLIVGIKDHFHSGEELNLEMHSTKKRPIILFRIKKVKKLT